MSLTNQARLAELHQQAARAPMAAAASHVNPITSQRTSYRERRMNSPWKRFASLKRRRSALEEPARAQSIAGSAVPPCSLDK